MALKSGEKVYRLHEPHYAGRELRAARLKLNMTAKAAAESVGLKQAQLSKMEAGQAYYGEATRARLQKWADMVGVTLNFEAGDWRVDYDVPAVTAPPAAGRYFTALTWAQAQGWLTGDQVVAVLMKAMA